MKFLKRFLKFRNTRTNNSKGNRIKTVKANKSSESKGYPTKEGKMRSLDVPDAVYEDDYSNSNSHKKTADPFKQPKQSKSKRCSDNLPKLKSKAKSKQKAESNGTKANSSTNENSSADERIKKVDSPILTLYDVKTRLGKGAYGIVWEATEKATGRQVALKKIFDAFRNSTDSQRTYREIMFLNEFGHHPNIISLLSVHKASNEQDIYLVFPYMTHDLHKLIKFKAECLTDDRIKYVVYQILIALKYIHSAEVIHRDLKPANILMNENLQVKVADFGLARSLTNEFEDSVTGQDPANQIMTDYVATRWYRPPEILLTCKTYTKGVDIWSIGCILAEMLLKKPLFPGNNTIHQIQTILKSIDCPTDEDIEELCQISQTKSMTPSVIKSGLEERGESLEDIFQKCGYEAIDILEQFLVFNPIKRLTVEHALIHPFFSSVRDPSFEWMCDRLVRPALSDNVRLQIDDYRNAIYQMIDREELSHEIRCPTAYLTESNEVVNEEEIEWGDIPKTTVDTVDNQQEDKCSNDQDNDGHLIEQGAGGDQEECFTYDDDGDDTLYPYKPKAGLKASYKSDSSSVNDDTYQDFKAWKTSHSVALAISDADKVSHRRNALPFINNTTSGYQLQAQKLTYDTKSIDTADNPYQDNYNDHDEEDDFIEHKAGGDQYNGHNTPNPYKPKGFKTSYKNDNSSINDDLYQDFKTWKTSLPFEIPDADKDISLRRNELPYINNTTSGYQFKAHREELPNLQNPYLLNPSAKISTRNNNIGDCYSVGSKSYQNRQPSKSNPPPSHQPSRQKPLFVQSKDNMIRDRTTHGYRSQSEDSLHNGESLILINGKSNSTSRRITAINLQRQKRPVDPVRKFTFNQNNFKEEVPANQNTRPYGGRQYDKKFHGPYFHQRLGLSQSLSDTAVRNKLNNSWKPKTGTSILESRMSGAPTDTELISRKPMSHSAYFPHSGVTHPLSDLRANSRSSHSVPNNVSSNHGNFTPSQPLQRYNSNHQFNSHYKSKEYPHNNNDNASKMEQQSRFQFSMSKPTPAPMNSSTIRASELFELRHNLSRRDKKSRNGKKY